MCRCVCAGTAQVCVCSPGVCSAGVCVQVQPGYVQMCVCSPGVQVHSRCAQEQPDTLLSPVVPAVLAMARGHLRAQRAVPRLQQLPQQLLHRGRVSDGPWSAGVGGW